MKTSVLLRMSFLLAILCSCSIERQLAGKFARAEDLYTEQWVGHSQAEVIAEFGAPDREVSDGADGIILVYETITTNSSFSEDLVQIGPTKSGSVSTSYDKRYVHFYIGPDKLCYKVKSNKAIYTGKHHPAEIARAVIVGSTIVTGLGVFMGLLSVL